MSFSPLTNFCQDVSSVATAAFLLSLPEFDPGPDLLTRECVFVDAFKTLRALLNGGKIDETFYDYLVMHLEYAFANGGV